MDTQREYLSVRYNAIANITEESSSYINVNKVGRNRAEVNASQRNSFFTAVDIIINLYEELNADEQKAIDDRVVKTISVWCEYDGKEKNVTDAEVFPSVVRKLGVKRNKVYSPGEFPLIDPIAALTNHGLSECFRTGIVTKDTYKNGYLTNIIDDLIEGEVPDIDTIHDDRVKCYKAEIIQRNANEPESITLRKNDVILVLSCTPTKSPMSGDRNNPIPSDFVNHGVTFSANMSTRFFEEVVKHTPFHIPTEYAARLFVVQELLTESKSGNTRVYNTTNMYETLKDLGVIELIIGICYLAIEWCATKELPAQGKKEDFYGVKRLLSDWKADRPPQKVPYFVREWGLAARRISYKYITPFDIGYRHRDSPGIHAACTAKLADQGVKGAERVAETQIPYVQTSTTVLLQSASFTTHSFHRSFVCYTASMYVAGTSHLTGISKVYECVLNALGRNIHKYGKSCDEVMSYMQRLVMSSHMIEVPDEMPNNTTDEPFEPNLKDHICYDLKAEVFLAHALGLKHDLLSEPLHRKYDVTKRTDQRRKIVNAIKAKDKDGLMHDAIDSVFENWDGSVADNLNRNAIHYSNNSLLQVYTTLSRVSVMGGFQRMDPVLYQGFSDEHRKVMFDRDPKAPMEKFGKFFVDELKANMTTINPPGLKELIKHSQKAIKSASGGGDSVTIKKVSLKDALNDPRASGSDKEEVAISLKTKQAIPVIMPYQFAPEEGTEYVIDRLSTPEFPFGLGKRDVPVRKTRPVMNVPTGHQILNSPVYNSFVEYQGRAVNKHYLLAHDEGAVCQKLFDFISQSLLICISQVVAYLVAALDYKSMDNFESHRVWNFYDIAVDESVINTHPEFQDMFGKSYKDVIKSIITSFADSYYLYKGTGCPSQVVRSSGMPSGTILTANGNTAFTIAHLKMVMAEYLPPGVSMPYYGAWGDDCTAIFNVPKSMTYSDLISFLDNVKNSSEECGQVWDAYDGTGPGEFIDILKTFYMNGQTFKRHLPYDSERSVVLTTPGDISPILTNVVDMSVRGFNSRALNVMILSLIIMGRTDSVFGYNYTFNFFDMLMPGGLCGIMPIGYPQAASTNYMRIMCPEIFGIQDIIRRPRMSEPYQVGNRMIKAATTITTKIGGITRAPAAKALIEKSDLLYLENERIVEEKNLVDSDKQLFKEYRASEIGRSSDADEGKEIFEASLYKNSNVNQLAAGLGSSLINSHLSSKYKQVNLEREKLIQTRSGESVRDDPIRVPMLSANILKYDLFKIAFFIDSVANEKHFELAIPLKPDGDFRILYSSINTKREVKQLFKRCYTPFLVMPRVFTYIIGLLGVQFKQNSLEHVTSLGKFAVKHRRDHISSEQVLEKLKRTDHQYESIMLRSLGFTEIEIVQMIAAKRNNELDKIMEKVEFTEYSSNPDVLKSVSTSRLTTIFTILLNDDIASNANLMDSKQGLKENIMSYYISLLYDQINVACEKGPNPHDDYLYVTMPRFVIRK